MESRERERGKNVICVVVSRSSEDLLPRRLRPGRVARDAVTCSIERVTPTCSHATLLESPSRKMTETSLKQGGVNSVIYQSRGVQHAQKL